MRKSPRFKRRISECIMDGYQNGEITEYERDCMIPKDPTVGRFYGLAKDHKSYKKIPEFRPISSINGTMTENISKFVDYHSKDLVKSIPSHLDDTPDFLRQIEDFKKTTGYIGDDVVPVSIDVTGLYPNIPIDEGLLAFEEALDTRTKREASTNFLISLLQLVLTGNVVEFNKKNFLQIWGTSMGSGCSPSYADIFMAKLERGFLE